MRPLRLAIEGFTAFRDRQEIDFEELELFVITGPTGAGKTSILDAIVFALYGQVPRLGGKQGTTDLVSLGTVQARVMFEFSIQGKGRYRVARRLKRQAAQTATLEHLDGEEWVSACERDGVRECERVLGELLELDYDSFCKAVVLPQGEFHRFLKGDPGERRKVLVSLLGVAYFERMGALARARQSDLTSKVSRTEEIVLDQYGQTSAERVTETHSASIEAAERSSRLGTALAEAEKHAEEGARQTRRADALGASTNELERLATASRETIKSCQAAEESTAEARATLTRAAADHETAQHQLEDANAALSTLEAETGTIEALAEAAAAAQTLASASAEETAAENKLNVTQTARSAAEQELASAKEDEVNLNPVVQERIEAEDAAGPALERARERARALEHRATQARSASEQLGRACEQLRITKAAAESARVQAEEFDAALERAIAHLEAHRRANAVAELAGGLAVDDPCPVCGVALAAPPLVAGDVAQGLVIARKAEQSARSVAEKARDTAARAAASVESAEQALGAKQEQHTEALDGHPDLAAAESESSAATTAAEEASRQLGEARLRREAAEADAKRARERTLTALAQLEGKTAVRDEASTALEEVRKRKQSAVATLAGKFDGQVPANAVEQIASERERLIVAGELSKRARAEHESRRQARESARGAVQSAEEQLAELDIELTRLRTLAETTASSVSVQLEDAALLSIPASTADRSADATELASWCESAAAAARHAHDEADKARVHREAQIMRISSEHEGNAADAKRAVNELRASERSARDAASRAQSAEEEAERRLAEREAMEQTIKEERAQIAVLTDLTLELRGDRFGDYIVTETLQLLAAHASRELLRISDGRYSLVTDEGDFEVIDHANADERRNVRTLSGGETFLASLALALALSRHVGDLASDGLGTKLEAVFIDEGFGTLDPETLDDVIDALERLRAENLMVGVISHVPELGQRVRSGLEVHKEQGRSTILMSTGA